MQIAILGLENKDCVMRDNWGNFRCDFVISGSLSAGILEPVCLADISEACDEQKAF